MMDISILLKEYCRYNNYIKLLRDISSVQRSICVRRMKYEIKLPKISKDQ